MRAFPKRAMATAAILGVALGAGLPAQAQQRPYPSQPIRVIVPFSAGTSDTVARLVSVEMAKALGQPMVVENRPGAGGNLGSEACARAPADGHTLTMGTTSTFVVNPTLNPRAGYTFERDFTPVAGIARSFYAVVVADTAAAPRTLEQLFERLRSAGGAGTFATSGAGTITHLCSEVLLHRAGLSATHVPYRGSGPALTDVTAGQVLFASDTLAATLPLVRGGGLRALAVTGPERNPALPQVPTLIESGFPGLTVDAWFGIAAPVGTPEPVVAALSEAIIAAVTSPEARPRFDALGIELLALPPPAFASFVRESAGFWREFIRASGIRIEF
jgi:tripartite-type tricarboxylate transporter receptor subunit TctC